MTGTITKAEKRRQSTDAEVVADNTERCESFTSETHSQELAQ
jgi:hypothetical protein